MSHISRRTSLHSSKSAIKVLPTLRKARPNGIFMLETSSASDWSSCSDDLSTSSCCSSDDEWSDDDFEDPLWVKDDNLRPRRRLKRASKKSTSASSPSLPIVTMPSMNTTQRLNSDLDKMVIEEDATPRDSESDAMAIVRDERSASAPPAAAPKNKRSRTKSKKSSGTGSATAAVESEEVAFRAFVGKLNTSVLDENAVRERTEFTATPRFKAFSVNLTPRGGFLSSASTSRVSPQQRERERRQMEREIMSQRFSQAQATSSQRHSPVIPPLAMQDEVPKKGEAKSGSFLRKKMRGVKAYFSSSSPTASPTPSSPLVPLSDRSSTRWRTTSREC